MQFLSKPPIQIITFICSLLAIPSIILAIIFHLKSRHKLELSYAKYSYSLIEQKKAISKLKIIFDNSEVESITISKFAIWNSGHDPINQSNNEFIKPLRLYCQNGAKILDTSIVCETDKDNKYTVDPVSENECHISMKYMDPNDGCVIQVVHTGNTQDIGIDCKLIGGKKLREYSFHKRVNIKRTSKAFKVVDKVTDILLSVLPIQLALLMFVCSILPFLERNNTQPDIPQLTTVEEQVANTNAGESLFFSISCIVAGLVSLFFGIIIIQVQYKIGIPRKLKSYCEKE